MPRPSVFAPRVARRGRAFGKTGFGLGLIFGLLVCLAAPRAARANGAFPASFQLLLPADRPNQIALATNFGLILSEDDGATWTWTCEQAETANGSLYAVGAPPLDRFYSVSPLVGLAYSDDDSCSWKPAGGQLGGLLATDFWPDPTNPMRVLAIAQDYNGETPQRVFPSADGGATFGAPIFQAGPSDVLDGIETSRSDPNRIYVAAFSLEGGVHPKLVRSDDGGATWTTIDVEAALGPNNFRIIAIDPMDPDTITLRVIESGRESLAISRDGGATFTKPISRDGLVLTAYTKLDSGTLLVAGYILDQGLGFRSTDGGMTFQDWKVPHLLGLSTRGGKLYAAAKNYTDDWAVGVSTDEGLTFTPLTRYDQVSAVRACVAAVCRSNCEAQVAKQVWELPVCTASEEPTSSGCGCAAVASATPTLGGLALVWALAWRRRRGRAPHRR